MTKKGLLALAVAAVVAGGTGTAIAAGTGALASKPTEDAWVVALAKKLGTTPDKLVEALQGVATDKIDALVKAGTITQAQADKLKARVAETGGLGFRGGFGGKGGFGPGGPGMRGGLGDPMAAAAAYLGITEDALDTALDGGTKLADIIKDKGKTADGLKAALVADAKKAIDALTTATDAQKKALLDGAGTRADALIASSLGHDRSVTGPGGMGFDGPGMGGRGGHGGHGPGGFGGRGGHDRDGFGGRGGHGGLPGMGNGPSVDQLPAPGASFRGGKAATGTGV